MPVSPARAVAFDILQEIERRQSFAVDLLHSDLTAFLPEKDRSLCMQLVMGVLRWQSSVDAEINRATQNKKLDIEVRLALRLAIFQVRHLDRIPARAAVNESVELVKRARKRSAVPFVNAVLRNLADPLPGESLQLHERFAHPAWMVERWIAQFGLEQAEFICAFDQQVPHTSLRLRQTDHAQLADELESAGLKLAPGRIMTTARIVLSGDVTATAAFRQGHVAIQDEGSQLVAALVGTGKRILDCCAAPGGKTSAVADRNPSARILGVELHEHRLRLMRKMVKAPNVEFLHADITSLPSKDSFDRILADVPCSGTGTIARNPEIKWRLTPKDLADLQKRQISILKSAMSRLENGGRLVYSTCSLEMEENQEVVENSLQKGFRLLDCREALAVLKTNGELAWPDPESLCQGPYLRTIPGVHPCDGFFAAIFQRD